MDNDMALHDALALTRDAIQAAGYGSRVESIASLIGQGPKIAFEILCSNLYEFDCPVPLQAYLHLEKLGQEYAASAWGKSLNITPETWEVLKPLVNAKSNPQEL